MARPALSLRGKRRLAAAVWLLGFQCRWTVGLALSCFLHAFLIAALGGWRFEGLRGAEHGQANPAPPLELVVQVEPEPPPPLTLLPLAEPSPLPDGSALLPAAVDSPATAPQSPSIAAPLAGASSAASPPLAKAAPLVAPPQTLALRTELPVGGGLAGRLADARSQLVAERGGTPRSEAAVERGLAWLVQHQEASGGWRFDHRGGPCDGRCANPGSESSTTAATALALLPLLGAGQTPAGGQHRAAVERGLDYLRGRMVSTPRGGDLQEGTMYGQGLAAIALSEAYALNGDSAAGEAAQQALDFIAAAQHPLGGWRYFPGQAGDTTVLGWQWMALKSGQMAGLKVDPVTLARAAEFLDSVQTDDGAAYGYQRAGADQTPTAIGLLCRMYSGWRRTDPRLVRGVERLAADGPSYDDLYFDYYAAQVLHHAETPSWEAFNRRLREHLIATQAADGHEAGSWHFGDYHTAPGGRLCDTALALLILEVYYRHLPLYGWKSVEL